jgi:hypothetical protein
VHGEKIFCGDTVEKYIAEAFKQTLTVSTIELVFGELRSSNHYRT